MAEWDWLDFETGPGGYGFGDVGADYSSGYGYGGYGYDMGPYVSNAATPLDYSGYYGGGPGSFGGQVTTDYANGPFDTGMAGGGGGLLNTILGGLGQVGSFLGKNAGTIGPLLSGAGSIAGGAIGGGAANEAARLQSQALNRGIDLQTAQWLQQQQNLAPYLQAGQQGVSTLQQLAGREQPGLPGATPAVPGANYPLPGTTPGWQPEAYRGPQAVNAQDYRYTPGAPPQASQFGYQGPQAVQAGDYRWQPGQGPQAADYRYTPGQGPRAGDYRYTPGQTPDAANYRYTPGAVPTLSGQELLANDPGVAFRMEEGRKALESSAAAKGGLLSGGTLAALQRQGQELSSQEYGQAFSRAAQQAQMREQWQQTATGQNFSQAMQAAQLREQLQQQATQQGWSQAQTEAAFREQLQQVATQQGWSQAQTEAAFREQMAQQSSQQGFQQALGAQGQEWQQGFGRSQADWQMANLESQTADERARAASQLGFGQALQGQQTAWQQGLGLDQWHQQQNQQYQQEMYNRMLQQNQLQYGRDVYGNEQDYTRQQQFYRQQLGQSLLPWEQASTLANLGGQATSMYGTQGGNASRGIADLLAQLGSAQGVGQYGSGLSWQNALTGAGNQIRPLLSGLNA